MFLFIYMQLNLFLNIFGFILEYRQALATLWRDSCNSMVIRLS
jgi:hypothetical protein